MFFYAPNMRSDKVIDKEIPLEFSGARCVVVLWSENSIDSDWVKWEASQGRQRLIEVVLDRSEPPPSFGRTALVDFSQWRFGRRFPGFSKLSEGIAARTQRPASYLERPKKTQPITDELTFPLQGSQLHSDISVDPSYHIGL